MFVTRATLAPKKLYKIKGFVMQVRVYYEDTDIGGVVYYANYLKFCERARSEIFFERGLSPIGESGAFVVKSLSAEYLKSAVFGDELQITTKVIEKKGASISLLQEVFRGEEKLFCMNIRLAFVKDSKPSKIPPEIISLFE